jgi:hypothetical protein
MNDKLFVKNKIIQKQGKFNSFIIDIRLSSLTTSTIDKEDKLIYQNPLLIVKVTHSIHSIQLQEGNNILTVVPLNILDYALIIDDLSIYVV